MLSVVELRPSVKCHRHTVNTMFQTKMIQAIVVVIIVSSAVWALISLFR